jgi:hypothetical protein
LSLATALSNVFLSITSTQLNVIAESEEIHSDSQDNAGRFVFGKDL